MASVDLATLALELNTTGLARGEREASSILARLEKRFDATVQRAKAINKAINDALNMNAGASRSEQAFNRAESSFIRHNQRIIEISAKSATKLAEIEAKKSATIETDREKSANRVLAIDRKAAAQAESSAAKLQQIQAASAGKIGVAYNRRVQAQIQSDGKLQQIALQSTAKLEAEALKSSARLAEIDRRKLASIDVLRERFAQREIERQRRVAAQQARATQGGTFDRFLRQSSTIREAGESIQQAGAGLSFLSAQFIAVGAAAVKSAFDIDKNVNTIKAFVGSAEAAENRLRALIEVSQRTPGLTTSLAATLDAQLRIANVSVANIDKLLPAIGRLNAVSPLGNPEQFTRNLTQLIDQNFDLPDLKELIGNSPIAGQILAQLFSVDSPTNGEAIRKSAQKLGIRTTDDFFKAFAEAAGKNQALANVTESLETRFLKLVDRVKVALRPLGLSIIEALEPLVARAVPIIERLAKAFDDLPDSAKKAIIVFGLVTAAIAPLIIAFGSITQSIGAVGNLLKVFSVLGGAGGSVTAGAGIAASLGTIATVLGVVTVAVGALAAAWATNFGDIRGITSEFVTFAKEEFSELSEFWKSNVGDFNKTADPALRKLKDLFQFYSETVGAVWKGLWDFFSTTAREALDVVKPAVTGFFALLRGDFARFKDDSTRFWKETWDFIITVNAQGIVSVADVIEKGLTSLLSTTKVADALGNALGFNIVAGIKAGFIAAFPGTAGVISSLVGNARKIVGVKTDQREFVRGINADAANALAIEEDLLKRVGSPSSGTTTKPKPPALPKPAGGKSREAAARELRAAEEQLAKARAESLFRLEEKSLQSRLELERANYEKRITDAQGFFENRKRIELDLLKITEQRIKGEAAASASRLNAAKDGSPEATRELAQLVELQSQLRIVEVERADKIRELNEELEKNLKLESERNKELLAAGANAQLPLLQRTADNFFARQQSERRDPDAEFRREEIRLQVLANQGLIRESELTDGLILKQREIRQLFIEQAESRKRQAEAQANQEGRFFDPREFDLEIERLQLLGSELTRAERLRKRFADQGILDYSRLNESVEELLAEQKGITEIFADFRANIVRDQFGLIERGVDKLTERLGILGDAIGSLLKDLAKLAVSAIFRKLFGIGGGGQPGFAGGSGFPVQQGGGGGLLGSLVGGFGGGGGGGFAPFATGGFSGGNPAQQILSGGGVGSGIPGGGILSKIPILGKLFGGGASTSAGGASGAVSAAKTAAGIGTQAPGLAASLGAGGLLAGGGLLGSFAGGNSQFGRLLGGVGGTLLGGVVGASGLLGGGVAGALPALFSNPITAVIGGALIGGALLARFFGDREFNKFRKETDKEYQLKVDNKQAGRELYKSIKAFGEEQFGKGKFGKKIVDTIRLTKAQEQLADYGEATGQENNPLVKKFRDRKELTDQFDPRNQFIKRANGGDVRAFQPYIVGDAGRPEVFIPSRDGQIVPSFGDFAREVSRATAQPAQETGGAWTAEFRRVMQTMIATNARMAAALARFESMPPEQVIVTGARRAPDAITGAVNMSLSRATEAGRAMKDEVYKGR